jgi:hypothetical protein
VHIFVEAAALAVVIGCTGACGGDIGGGPADEGQAANLDGVAEEYVHLALALDEHDEDYVDAYYGPPEWQREAESTAVSLGELRSRAESALVALARLPTAAAEIDGQRRAMLQKRLRAMLLRIDMADPQRSDSLPKFDEESRVLFDAEAPDHDAAHFERIVERAAAIVPGEGPLAARVEAFRKRFEIPQDRLSAVFDAAVAECRRRTVEHPRCPRTSASRSST